MRRTMCWVALVVLTAVAAGLTLFSQNRGAAAELLMPAGASYHIALGVGDREASSWDGSIAVSAGAIASIEGVRFAAGDSTDSKSSWKASTHRAPTIPNQPGPLVPNGVIVTTTTDDPAATFNVKTAQGNFSFSARDIAWDQGKTFLAGRVRVERAPNLARLTTSSEDQDYPAIAQTDDAVYVAYVEFKHANPDMEGNRPLTAEPKSFDYLARPAGGDQVMLMRYTKASKKWSSGMPVSAPNQDVVRTSVAVDGQKRVWVFWSARQNGNYDIYAKNLAGGKWSNEVRITSDPGTDLNPVAATDSKGRVWVAWQGYRNKNLEILAAAQNGDAFSPETILSFSKASDWDPAIATSSNGEVAVAWDTYDKGDYDVYFRRLHMTGSIKMDPPVPVAAGKGFEARASATYDAQNRLWIAYEASANQWGKDWGAYETSGVALYQDHTVKVKCFQGNQVLAPQGDLAKALPAALLYNAAGQMSGSESRDMTFPNSEIVKTRQPNQDPAPPPLPKNSFPKIASDPAGAIYLTFRTPMQGRTGLGTVWETRVAYLDGNTWKPSIPVPDTDYWLDVRAAMTAVGPGDLLLVSVQDHRLAISRPPAAAGAVTKKKMAGQKKAMNKGALAAAAFNPALNADLVAAEFRFGSLHQATTKPAAPEQVSAPDAVTAPERQQIKMMRDYRAKAGSDKLQIMRGEFHRHTEISTDGGNDGPIIDAYRYMIDAAMMDWGVCCDHDNGNGREYTWWIAQKLTDAYHIPGTYTPMFGYERSVQYPEGHRNAVIPIRGVRPLPRLPIMDADSAPTHAPDTQMLYRYLKRFNAIVASHTSGTNMGTDWRDNDPQVEPVVEIYQGDRQNYEIPDGPRSNSANDSIGGWRPLGFVSLALMKGYRLGFQASSDHVSTHMSYCNLWVTSPTREGIMEAFHKRRVYGSTDNILADVRCQGHFMGEEFTLKEAPAIEVKLWGTGNFANVKIIKDNNYVYGVAPGKKNVEFTWRDTAAVKGKTSYYYVRGEQADGELVWVSPMWITYQ